MALKYGKKRQAIAEKIRDRFISFSSTCCARYYDPSTSTGRFTQRDPQGFVDGVNRYAYVRNNPTNYADPEGMLGFPWHFGISYVAARDSGYGVTDSLGLAWNAMAVDFREGSQGPTPASTAQHAMIGQYQGQPSAQSPAQAALAVRDYISYNTSLNTSLSLGAALHTVQDAATPMHGGQQWPPQGGSWWDNTLQTAKHIAQDTFPSLTTIGIAYGASMQALSTAQNSSGALPEPFDIQSPRYGFSPPSTQSLTSFTALPPSNSFSDSLCYACIGSYSSGGSGTMRSK